MAIERKISQRKRVSPYKEQPSSFVFPILRRLAKGVPVPRALNGRSPLQSLFRNRQQRNKNGIPRHDASSHMVYGQTFYHTLPWVLQTVPRPTWSSLPNPWNRRRCRTPFHRGPQNNASPINPGSGLPADPLRCSNGPLCRYRAHRFPHTFANGPYPC